MPAARRNRDHEQELHDLRVGNRDYAMARLGAAVAALDGAKESVMEALTVFVSPGDDPKGRARMTAVDDALEAAGIATRSLEDAIDLMRSDEGVDFEVGEPWEEEDDDPDGAD